VACALCGGASFSPLWACGSGDEGGRFAFSRCARCGLVQQNPQPLPQAVAARYGESYLRYEEANQFAYRDLELLALGDLGLEAEAAALFARARAEGRRPRVLDAGCATGSLLDALRDAGWEPQGVELARELAGYGEGRFNLPIFAGTLEAACFPAGRFELVHASHLIEHLNDPRSFLAEAARVTAPGGLLVVTTPNVDGFQARLLGSRWRSAIYDHLYLFSRRNLARLLEFEGFTVLRSVTWGGWARGLKPAFAKGPLDRLAKAWGFGDVVALLARRAV
jgi:SAM-dependent methyltransferase